MFCTQCGTKNDDNAKFCASCGTAIAEAGLTARGFEASSDEELRKKSNKTLITWFGISCCVLVALGAFLFYKPTQQSEQVQQATDTTTKSPQAKVDTPSTESADDSEQKPSSEFEERAIDFVKKQLQKQQVKNIVQTHITPTVWAKCFIPTASALTSVRNIKEEDERNNSIYLWTMFFYGQRTVYNEWIASGVPRKQLDDMREPFNAHYIANAKNQEVMSTAVRECLSIADAMMQEHEELLKRSN